MARPDGLQVTDPASLTGPGVASPGECAPSFLLLLATGLAGAFLLFASTLHYGFAYDDYHQLRPYTTAEVAGAFRGSWDPTGVEVPFYRPLTTAFYAIRFAALGVDARAYHAASLVLFGIAAGLVGLFVARATGRRWLGFLATLLYTAHPAMPQAQAVWATNQMHLLESLAVVGGLLYWQTVAERSGRWWIPLLGVETVAFLLKEDGLLLLPVILLAHVPWRALVRSRATPVSPAMLLAGVGMLAGLLALRWYALGGVGGYGVPVVEVAQRNLWLGVRGVVFFSRCPAPWREILTAANASLLVAGATAAVVCFRRARPEAWLLLVGVATFAVFNLPFALVSKPEQWHLLALGAVLAIAGAVGALAQATARTSFRAAVGTASVSLVVAMAVASARVAATAFAPLSEATLAHDRIVTEWAAVSPELREALRVKLNTRDPGAVELGLRMPYLSFGLYDWESTGGAESWRYRWMGPRALLLCAPEVRMVELPVSAMMTPANGGRVTVEVHVRGRSVATRSLTDGRITWIAVPLRRRRGGWWATATWVELRASPAWVPARVDPSSKDTRELGLRVGEPRLYY